MASAAEKLAEKFQQININIPNMALIHNVDVAIHDSAEQITDALKEQLFKPVRWVESIRYIHQQGVADFVECGPGKVLMGLNKRIAKGANHMTMYNPITLDNVLEQLNG